MQHLSDEMVSFADEINTKIPDHIREAVQEGLKELRHTDPQAELALHILETFVAGGAEAFRESWESHPELKEQGIDLELITVLELAKAGAVLRETALEQYRLEAKTDSEEIFAMNCTAGNLWQRAVYTFDLACRMESNGYSPEEAMTFAKSLADPEKIAPENRYEVVLNMLHTLK